MGNLRKTDLGLGIQELNTNNSLEGTYTLLISTCCDDHIAWDLLVKDLA